MSFWQSMPNDRLLAELSLWSADLSRLAEEIERSDPYADMYHLDAADGQFSPRLLFFPDLVAALRPLTRKPFHVHLMIENKGLLAQIDQFAEAGANLITIFCENGDLVPTALERIRQSDAVAGLALGLQVSPDAVVPYFDRIELITLMGTEIGLKGQSLSEQACSRISATRRLVEEYGYGGRIKIAADGGIRSHTVPDLRAAGADTAVMGSLAYGSRDLEQTFQWLWSLQGPVA